MIKGRVMNHVYSFSFVEFTFNFEQFFIHSLTFTYFIYQPKIFFVLHEIKKSTDVFAAWCLLHLLCQPFLHLDFNTCWCIKSTTLFWKLLHCDSFSGFEIYAQPHKSNTSLSKYIWLFVPSRWSVTILLLLLVTEIHNLFIFIFWCHLLWTWLMHYLIDVLLKIIDVVLSIHLLSILNLLRLWINSIIRIVYKLLCSCIVSLCINIIWHFSCAYDLNSIKIIMVIIYDIWISLLLIVFTNLFLRLSMGWSAIVKIHLAIALGYLCGLFTSFGLFLTAGRLSLYEIVSLGLWIPRWHLWTLN